MGFHVSARQGRHQPNQEMNMIPLIDVMLVLVIIFMVTAPLMTHAVKLNLPKANSQTNSVVADTLSFSIQAGGELFLNKQPISWADLGPRLEQAAVAAPQPEVHIRADENAPYKHVATLLSQASAAGLSRIGFVTDPQR